ncbi:hypothetical protein FCG16_06205, partial [Neisseria meningitidis]|nr:hypothetical protein [Neisseria meningitidis]MBG8785976.1 hypothetical protein [Neisseria meningitidis]
MSGCASRILSCNRFCANSVLSSARNIISGKTAVKRRRQYSGLTKPVRRCLALAQRERFSKVLKHQVNRFRT